MDRRFWPLFWVQFLTAFNDNVLKMGLVLLVTYGADLFGQPVLVLGMGAGLLNTLGGLLLMVPFFLFSALAGQLADKLPKHKMMRGVKIAELLLMVVGAIGFSMAAAGLPAWGGAVLLGLIFLMGTQSAMFGPIKYAMLPQLLREPGELVGGNALIETGTYLAVLLGGMAATGLFVGPRGLGLHPTIGLYALGGGVLVFALIGVAVARMSPAVPAEKPSLPIQWDPIRSTWQVGKVLLQRRDLLFAVMANSWFWALGACLLSLVPSWTKNTLGGSELVVTLFMALFSIGIGIGSVLCARLSKGRVEMGLVVFGAVGIGVFLLDLTLGGAPWPTPPEGTSIGILGILSTFSGWRIVVDLLGLAGCGGLFMVPLYSFILDRGATGERAQLIGGLNIINAFFIVVALAAAFGGLALGVSERWLFGLLAAAHVFWILGCILYLPKESLRLLAELLIRTFYRARFEGMQNIPAEGPALLICNHVSYLDFMVLMAAIRRPHRFVIWHTFTEIPIAGALPRKYEVIPVSSDPEHRKVLVAAFKQIGNALSNGELVIIFPEGSLPYEVGLQPFMKGLQLILKRNPVPVIPMALNGLWGSMYSRKGGAAFKSWRMPRRTIWLTAAEAVPAEEGTLERLKDEVQAVWDRHPDDP
ncbi:MAG: 1-acyl-sn-glycerol-3-phosphate acyltransferase [Myxococcota bacterium]